MRVHFLAAICLLAVIPIAYADLLEGSTGNGTLTPLRTFDPTIPIAFSNPQSIGDGVEFCGQVRTFSEETFSLLADFDSSTLRLSPNQTSGASESPVYGVSFTDTDFSSNFVLSEILCANGSIFTPSALLASNTFDPDTHTHNLSFSG